MDLNETSCSESFERRNKILNTIQYFKISAEDFTDILFNISVDDFVACIPIINKSMLELCGSVEEVDNGTQKLIQRFYAKLEPNSEILEKYLEECILKIPDPCDDFLNTKEEKLVSEQEEKVLSLKRTLASQKREKLEIARQLHQLKKIEDKIESYQKMAKHYFTCVDQDQLSSLLKALSTLVASVTADCSFDY